MKLKKGDTVVVIAGKNKGEQGEIQAVLPKENKVLIGGLNIAKRHTKPRPVPGSGGQQMAPGGILDQEQPLRRSNVMLVCPSCDKATRTGRNDNGARVCRACGTEIDS